MLRRFVHFSLSKSGGVCLKSVPLIAGLPNSTFPQIQQVRTTFILKRRFTPPLAKLKHHNRYRKLKQRYFIYDLLEDTNVQPVPPLDVILLQDVLGIGLKGDVIPVRRSLARNELLPSGQAAYCSPENLEEYSELIKQREIEKTSTKGIQRSPYTEYTLNRLSSFTLDVIMNKDMSWKITKKHISANFRKGGVVVPEHAITLPADIEEITNTNPQDFEVKVVINQNPENEVTVKCKLFLYDSTTGELPGNLTHRRTNPLAYET